MMQRGLRVIKYNTPVDIIEHYDEFIKSENERNRKERYEGKEKWYHASGAGSCSRKLYYESVLKTEPSNAINSNSLRLMRLGTIVHNDIQRSLTLYSNDVNKEIESNKEKENKPKFYVEGEIKIPSLNVRGFYDVVSENGEVYLFDIKTCASYSWTMKFGRKKQFDPSIHYELQLGTYGYAVQEEFGRLDGMYLLFYNKDKSITRPVEVPLSFVSRAYLYWKNVNDEHKQGLPEFRKGVSPVQAWNCKYCQFLDICNPPK